MSPNIVRNDTQAVFYVKGLPSSKSIYDAFDDRIVDASGALRAPKNNEPVPANDVRRFLQSPLFISERPDGPRESWRRLVLEKPPTSWVMRTRQVRYVYTPTSTLVPGDFVEVMINLVYHVTDDGDVPHAYGVSVQKGHRGTAQIFAGEISESLDVLPSKGPNGLSHVALRKSPHPLSACDAALGDAESPAVSPVDL